MQRMNVAMVDELETTPHDVKQRCVETGKRMEGPINVTVTLSRGEYGGWK
jgi:hypothetical protein